jgi:hypothetical protein
MGRVNGVGYVGLFRPPVASIIYGAGGSAVAWWSIAAVAVADALDLCWIARPKDDTLACTIGFRFLHSRNSQRTVFLQLLARTLPNSSFSFLQHSLANIVDYRTTL